MELIQDNWVALLACCISAWALHVSREAGKQSKHTELRLRLDVLRLRGEQLLQKGVSNRRVILQLQSATTSLQSRIKQAVESQRILSEVYETRFGELPDDYSSMSINSDTADWFENKFSCEVKLTKQLFVACESNYEIIKSTCLALPDGVDDKSLGGIDFVCFENIIYEIKRKFEMDRAAIIAFEQSSEEFEQLIESFEDAVLCFEGFLDERIKNEATDNAVR